MLATQAVWNVLIKTGVNSVTQLIIQLANNVLHAKQPFQVAVHVQVKIIVLNVWANSYPLIIQHSIVNVMEIHHICTEMDKAVVFVMMDII